MNYFQDQTKKTQKEFTTNLKKKSQNPRRKEEKMLEDCRSSDEGRHGSLQLLGRGSPSLAHLATSRLSSSGSDGGCRARVEEGSGGVRAQSWGQVWEKMDKDY